MCSGTKASQTRALLEPLARIPSVRSPPQSSSTSNADKAAFQSQLDSLSSKGDKIALTANVCYIAGAVALVTAVVIGYPAYKARNSTVEPAKPVSPETGTNMSFLLAPTPSMKGGTAGFALTF